MTQDKKIGLIGKRKNGYVEPIEPKESYSGTNKSNDNNDQKELEHLLTSERGTIRPLLEQKLELEALLAISDYQYSYEILAELIYSQVQKLSKEQSLKYQENLSDLKRKEINKIKKKKKNK